ncbi:MAG: copper resistance system multicopper oxidase, partial [Pseudomonadota bacterium]|nr:copper resistance system multicopper oxidase [Pseudomonadota bacterium]
MLPPPSRRRFVQGLALASGAAVIGAPIWTRAQGVGADPTMLTGNKLDLTIGERPINITGKRRMATAVNGQVPGPTLRLREGDDVIIAVTNRLREPTSIHWHGFRLPANMDGVPGLTFKGIMPGETFTYRFPIVQSGTYWYHSHSGMQEQTGLYGAVVLEPKQRPPYAFDREYVIVLSDWTDENPMTVVANMKMQGDYYNFHQRTLGTFLDDTRRKGFKATLADWSMWGAMRMSPTDIMDVTGATYTFLINGQPPASNWTALFAPGERVLLRFINSAAMSTFDVRIPGLPLTVVAADGGDVQPVVVDQFRIGVAETYDVIVEPKADLAYTIFAQAEDRTGYARATLATRAGAAGAIPPMDHRPMRTMADMGMAGMDMGGGAKPGADMAGMKMGGMKMGASAQSGGKMAGMSEMPASKTPAVNADHVDPKKLPGQVNVDNVAVETQNRQGQPGAGLAGEDRTTLVYADLKALTPHQDARPVDRDIEFHLTGNMQRWTWGFDGKKFSQVGPIDVRLGETVRFVLINDTMMEHPIHLHGFLFSLENGNTGDLPLKHTVNVKPGERLSFVFTADTPGHWAFHCHLLYHMETGMFRT